MKHSVPSVTPIVYRCIALYTTFSFTYTFVFSQLAVERTLALAT